MAKIYETEENGKAGIETVITWMGTKNTLSMIQAMKGVGEALEKAVLRGSGFKLTAEFDLEAEDPTMMIRVFEYMKPKDEVQQAPEV